MKKFFRLFKVFATAFISLSVLFTSCNGLEPDSGFSQISISLDEIGRTAIPKNVSPEIFDSFTLKASQNGSETILGFWQYDSENLITAYSLMNRAVITIANGTYTFTLDANENNGASYTASIEKTVNQNDTLSFALELSSLSAGGIGNCEITVNFVNGQKASSVICQLYKTDKDNPVFSEVDYYRTSQKSYSVFPSDGSGSFTYNLNNIIAGCYYALFTFYDVNGLELCRDRELVWISDGLTSKSNKTVDLKKSFIITYNLNGGYMRSALSQVYSPFEDVTLAVPSKQNRTFAGWSTSEDGGETLSEETISGWTSMTHAGDITLYARWIYTVSFEPNGMDESPVAGTTASVSAYEGTALTLSENVFTRAGFTFSEWNTKADGTGTSYENGGLFTGVIDTKLYAVWGPHDPSKIVITFRSNGGPLVQLQEIAPASSVVEPVISREHYTFLGWYDNADFTGSAVNFDSFAPESDIVLYAKWLIDSFEISFDSGEGASEVPTVLADYGSSLTEPASPVKTGYTFVKWLLNGEEYNFTTPVTDEITLTAEWVINSYAVHFNSLGGSFVQSQTVQHGSAVVRPISNPTKSQKDFEGWYLSDDEGESLYDDPYDFASPVTGPLVLYAKWGTQKFSITFNTSGGSEVESQIVEFGQLITEPSPAPVKTGYHVVGWYTNSSCTGLAYDFTTPVTSLFTLYAKWEINSYTVSFVTNGGSEVSDRIIKHGNKLSKPSSTRNDYARAVWYTDAAFTSEYDFTSSVTGEFTLYAKWKRGSKDKASSYGDILFNDGSVSPSSASLTSAQINAVVGICCNASGGLFVCPNTCVRSSAWASNSASEKYNNYVDFIALRNLSDGASITSEAACSDMNYYMYDDGKYYSSGKNYWSMLIGQCLSDGVNSYSGTLWRRVEDELLGNIIINGDNYKSWIPTVKELSYVYIGRNSIKTAWDKVWDLSEDPNRLDFTTNGTYWSANTCNSSESTKAFAADFSTGKVTKADKSESEKVIAVFEYKK